MIETFELVLLVAEHGFKWKLVGKKLGTTPAAVRHRWHRILQRKRVPQEAILFDLDDVVQAAEESIGEMVEAEIAEMVDPRDVDALVAAANAEVVAETRECARELGFGACHE